MKKILDSIIDTLKEGDPLILASIIESTGSTPRDTGAMMIIHEDGRTQGTIGGGAIEHEVQIQAERLHLEKHSASKQYILAQNAAADLGMVCGGEVTVLFQYINKPETAEIFEYLVRAFEKDENAWLIRIINDGEILGMGVLDESGLHFTDCIPVNELKVHFGTKAVLVKGTQSYFIEPVVTAGRVYIFGGGHVSQALVPVLATVGFTCVVFEDREQFADKALFPSALDTLIGNYLEISEYIKIKENDYIIIMTRGHQADYEILEQVLRTKAAYIGCIGSRHKIAVTRKKLMENGLPEEDYARLHTPIGLDIKADTPEEIAVSITAELILHRATKTN